MNAYNHVLNSIIQARVKNLCNIITARMNDELENCNTYLANQDISSMHDCFVRASVYQEVIKALETLTTSEQIWP